MYPFPASGHTADEFKNFVKTEGQDHKINIPFPAGCAQNDMIVYGPWCGLADETVAAAAGATVSIHVKEGIRVSSRQIAPASVFNTVGQGVWFNPVDGLYYDTEDAGLFLVGYVDVVTGADGCFAFEKVRYVVKGVAT